MEQLRTFSCAASAVSGVTLYRTRAICSDSALHEGVRHRVGNDQAGGHFRRAVAHRQARQALPEKHGREQHQARARSPVAASRRSVLTSPAPNRSGSRLRHGGPPPCSHSSSKSPATGDQAASRTGRTPGMCRMSQRCIRCISIPGARALLEALERQAGPGGHEEHRRKALEEKQPQNTMTAQTAAMSSTSKPKMSTGVSSSVGHSTHTARPYRVVRRSAARVPPAQPDAQAVAVRPAAAPRPSRAPATPPGPART